MWCLQMVSAETMGDAAELGSFVDLTPFMLSDPNIDAGGIPTVWRWVYRC
jgi:hypothetical protein